MTGFLTDSNGFNVGGLDRNLFNTLQSSTSSYQGATAQNVGITDILCEGPIAGLVGGTSGVYLNDNPITDESTSSSFTPGALSAATITFDGTSATGTLSAGFFVPGFIQNTSNIRTLRLFQLEEAVTTTVSTNSLGIVEVSCVANSGTPFTEADWASAYDNGKMTELVNPGVVDKFGLSYFVNSTTMMFQPPGWGNEADFPDANSYLLRSWTKHNIVGTTTDTTITVDAGSLSGVPPAGTYKFIAITNKLTYDVNYDAALALTQSQNTLTKYDNLQFDIKLGRNPTSERSFNSFGDADGGSSSIIGSVSGINLTELKQLTTVSANSLNVTLLDSDATSYPENQHTDRNNSPTILDSADFGLDSSSKLLEADEIYYNIQYPSLKSNNFGESGNSEDAYAFYLMEISLKRNGVFGDYEHIFPNINPTYIKHKGFTTAPVNFEHRINLDVYRPFDDFKVRIIRVTRHIGLSVTSTGTNDGRPDRKKWQLAATANITQLGAIIKDRFTFPYTAATQLQFSSRDFKGVPKRSFHLRGKLVSIPDTYTPREYSASGKAEYEQFWGGEFKNIKYYTDNPAWIFLDLLLNTSYGAGKYLFLSDIDIYALYRISKYCDELVEDGKTVNATDLTLGEYYKIKTVGDTTFTNHGSSANTVNTEFRATSVGTGTGTVCGLEPRYRANIYLTKATDVYKVLKDMATIFTGLIYWMDSKITVVQDVAQDAVYSFSQANVIDGSFTYESTGSRTRVNQVIVTWNDPELNYEPVPLIVEDPEAISRQNKLITQAAVAFGCTSEGQATRLGKWKLWTAQNQNEVVSFSTSLAAGFLKPGDIINITDNKRTGIQYSGRTSAANSTTLTFDRSVTFNSGTTYELSTLVTAPAAFYTGQSPITINSNTYNQGDRVPEAFVYSGGSFSLTALDTEEKTSNAFLDSAGATELVTSWKEYTYVQANTVTNPGAAANQVTIASSGTFGVTPAVNSVWALREIDSDGLDISGSKKLYRILSVAQSASNIYNITGVEHSNEKYEEVERRYEVGVTPVSTFDEQEPQEIPSVQNLTISKTDLDNGNRQLTVRWDAPTDFARVDHYEIAHNISDDPRGNPVLVGDRTADFVVSSTATYEFRVRTVSSSGNKSPYTIIVISLGEEDDIILSADRVHGIVKGIISNNTTSLSSDGNSYGFENANAVVSSNAAPADPVTITTQSINVSNAPAGRETWIYFDHSAASIGLYEWNTDILNGRGFWRNIGTGSGGQTEFVEIGAVDSQPLTPSIVQDLDGQFSTHFVPGDIIVFKADLPTVASPAVFSAVALNAVSAQSILIDTVFESSLVGLKIWKLAFRPDPAKDALVVRLQGDQ